MKKISTLFKKNPNNLSLVTREIDPENAWVYEYGIPTRKFDGTAVCIMGGQLYKRYDVKFKKGKTVPADAIPCQEPDSITGHWPHWIKCERDNPNDKYAFEAFDKDVFFEDGTYELCGEKVGVNAEKIKGHTLIPHGKHILPITDFSYENLKKFLSDPDNDIEGIVFHDSSGQGRMCKIRKSDFEITRGK